MATLRPLRRWLPCILLAGLLGHCGGVAAQRSDGGSAPTDGQQTRAPEVTASSAGGSAEVGGGAGTGSDAELDLASAYCAALEGALVERVASGLASGDKACESDGDCAYVGGDVACAFRYSSVVLATSAVTATRAAIERDIAPVCDELAQRCVREPASDFQPPRDPLDVECYARACRPLDLDSLSCDELSNKASGRASDAMARAQRSCRSDADCVLVDYPVRCVAYCGHPLASLATAGVDAAQASVQGVEDHFCSEFERRACFGPIPLPCVEVPRQSIPQPTCVAGQCDIAYALVP